MMKLVDNINFFFLSIGVSKLSKAFTISNSHKSIIGGVCPHHFILIYSLYQDEVNKLLVGENSEGIWVEDISTFLFLMSICNIPICYSLWKNPIQQLSKWVQWYHFQIMCWILSRIQTNRLLIRMLMVLVFIITLSAESLVNYLK